MKKLHTIWIVAAVSAASCASTEPSEDIIPVVAVRVSPVRTMDLDLQVRAAARVYPLEEARIASRLTAPVRELGARKGDRVRSGQVLAELENNDLIAQRAEAEAAVADAEATLAKVSAGTLPADLERARGQVAVTQAALELAQSNYDRRSQLYRQGAIPERDLMTSQTELAQARVNADVADAELRLLENESGTRDVEIAESRLDQARGRLAFLDAQLDFAQIRSPFDGTITEQFVFPGDMARSDAFIFTVANLSVAVVRAQVPEAEAAAVRTGQTCFLVPADMPGDSFEGRVTVVNSAVDPGRRTVEVWCEIPNAESRLRAGVFGTLQITTEVLENTMVVPEAAVQLEEGTLNGVVMVARSDKTAERREVVTRLPVSGQVPVESGLASGDLVIFEGGYGLSDGARIEWTGDPE